MTEKKIATFKLKKGLADMLKGGVIMDVVTPEHAVIAEKAGACAVMALERVPADIRKDGILVFISLIVRWCCPYVRSPDDQGNPECSDYSRHGK